MLPIPKWKDTLREHLKRHRPKMYRQMEKSGKLEPYLTEAVESAKEQWHNIADRTNDDEMAWEIVQQDLFPMDEEDQPNLGETPGQTDQTED